MPDFPDQVFRQPAASSSVRERLRMRRRLRQRQRVRNALLLELGALVYELQRQGRRAPELLRAKAAEVATVDQEVRGLTDALDIEQPVSEIVADGVLGSCPACGALVASDARYCQRCGSPMVDQAPTEPEEGVGPVTPMARSGDGVGEVDDQVRDESVQSSEHRGTSAEGSG
jgi:hypothetical protein